jgi:hypothetical protein
MKKMWRFKDLKAGGIVNSYMTLKRLVDSGRLKPGRLISPNCRTWTDEEVEELITGSPVVRKTEARQAQAAE